LKTRCLSTIDCIGLYQIILARRFLSFDIVIAKSTITGKRTSKRDELGRSAYCRMTVALNRKERRRCTCHRETFISECARQSGLPDCLAFSCATKNEVD